MYLRSIICLFYFVSFVKSQNCSETGIFENFWFLTTIGIIFIEIFCLLICVLSCCCCYCLKRTKKGKMTKFYYVSWPYKRRSQVENEKRRNFEDSNVYDTINSRHVTDISYLSNQTEPKECRLSQSNPDLQMKDTSFYENNESCVYDYVFIAKAPSENDVYSVLK